MSNVNFETKAQYTYMASMTAQTQTTSAKDEDAKKTTASESEDQDTVEISNAASSDPSKQIYKPDMKKVNYLKSVLAEQENTLRDMVGKLMQGQNWSAKGQFNASFSGFEYFSQNAGGFTTESYKEFSASFEFNFEFTGTVTEEAKKQAEAMIAEDGPLGVNAVSKNILDFAKAISGNDPSKIELLFGAFEKGFNQAAAMFGGKSNMPEISGKTYDAVVKGFDEWRKEAGLKQEDVKEPANDTEVQADA